MNDKSIKDSDILTIISAIVLILSWIGTKADIPEPIKNILGIILILAAVILIFTLIYRIIIERIPEDTKERLNMIGKAIKGESIFSPNPHEGTLHYGGIRNIAIRIKTINYLMEGLLKSKYLEKSGYLIGQSFGYDFTNELNKEGKRLSNKDKLDRWVKYDSIAGWGKFIFTELNSDSLTGEIKIKNCFPCNGRERDKKYCKFMEGYLRGAINTIFEKDVNVEFTKKEPDRYCSFISISK